MPTGPLRLIMLDAWKRAREAQAIYGGTAQQYISGCLKLSWAKMLADKTTQQVMKKNRQSNRYWREQRAQQAIRATMPMVTPAYIASGYGVGGERQIMAGFGR